MRIVQNIFQDKEDLIAALAEIRAAPQTISSMKNHADNHEAVVHLDAIDELLLKMTLRLNAQKSEYKMKSSRRSLKEHPFS